MTCWALSDHSAAASKMGLRKKKEGKQRDQWKVISVTREDTLMVKSRAGEQRWRKVNTGERKLGVEIAEWARSGLSLEVMDEREGWKQEPVSQIS